jgi:hypothetical protein
MARPRDDLTGEGLDDRNGRGTIVALLALATAHDPRPASIKALAWRGRRRKAWLDAMSARRTSARTS